ncbi:DegT/DnrJ/EryC1/StrS family aminotransferase [uncultured Selenomonas sp.]|uniref:DegT/DnrJ/EryC1/StrS family aminotransferase n=1 Tax=uncultured Selenomonas sp. TaxID=159275 RepID=UPI0028DB931C|nr:DegT/DnrJ/EryC1/StrS family aminotransferase [uncultured Selenomonas sp.]
MKIDLAVLGRRFERHQTEYENAALRVLRSGYYVLGPEVEAFEQDFAAYTGAKYAVGVNSGLDALRLSVRALDIGAGDEVIVPANTYIATVLAVTENGACPVFIEPDACFGLSAEYLAAAISPRTKAIIVVHLYGQGADLASIMEIAKAHGIPVIEDCAQSHGAHFARRMTGRFGALGCFSFYPTKNLGAFGDAGAVVTDSAELAEKIRMMRNYGSKVKYQNEIAGVNSRLDEMQAALLRVGLRHLPEEIEERQRIAAEYREHISNPWLALPKKREAAEHTYHQFVVRSKHRDDFQRYLKEHGVTTLIHYPVPPHLAQCYRDLGHQAGDFPLAEEMAQEVLSLPLFNGMTQEEVQCVIDLCNDYRPILGGDEG